MPGSKVHPGWCCFSPGRVACLSSWTCCISGVLRFSCWTVLLLDLSFHCSFRVGCDSASSKHCKNFSVTPCFVCDPSLHPVLVVRYHATVHASAGDAVHVLMVLQKNKECLRWWVPTGPTTSTWSTVFHSGRCGKLGRAQHFVFGCNVSIEKLLIFSASPYLYVSTYCIYTYIYICLVSVDYMLWENPIGRKRSLSHPFAMDFRVVRRIPRIESMKWYGRVNIQDIFLKPLWFSVCCLLVLDNYVHLQLCTRQSLSTTAANGDDNLVDMSSLLQDIAVMDFCSVADGRPSGGYANTRSFWSGLKHCNVWPSF